MVQQSVWGFGGFVDKGPKGFRFGPFVENPKPSNPKPSSADVARIVGMSVQQLKA